MAATDARPVPQKGVAYRHYFAIRATDCSLVTTWAGQDSELSGDGGAFADCTNEATEIGSSGVGYLDLTAAEMAYDCVVLKITVTNTDAIAYVVTLFPEEAGDIRADATQISGSTTAADNLETAGLAYSATRGLAGTALPAAAADAAGGLPVSDAGGLDLDTLLARLDAAISSRMATFTLPTNFAALGINVSGHLSRVTLVDTTTTNTDMRGTDAALLATADGATFTAIPDMATTTGQSQLGMLLLDIGTNGVTLVNGSITAAKFAADVEAEVRDWLGLAEANLDTQLADKSGYKLAEDGLDVVSDASPAGDPTAWNFRERLAALWLQRFSKVVHDASAGTITLFDTDGQTVICTQTATATGMTETLGLAAAP